MMRRLLTLLLVVGLCGAMSGCADNGAQVAQMGPLKSFKLFCGPGLMLEWGDAKPEAAPATSQPVTEDD